MLIKNEYQPHRGQLTFHQSEAKFRAIISGVGFGKSAAGANEVIRWAMQYPRATHLILAPNSKILRNATLAQFWKFCPKELIHDHKKSESMIYMASGAKIIYLTADNERHVDRLRGIEIGSFWLDEGALLLRILWDIILGRMRDPRGPLKGIVTTTPKGFNWLYFLFVKKLHHSGRSELKNKDQYSYFGGSTLDNPFTPEEYKKNLKQQYAGKILQQELYGQFVGFEGMVYDNFILDTHVIKKAPRVLKEYIAGIDFGFTNPAAAVIIGFDADGRAYVVDEFYQTRAGPDIIKKWLLSKQKEYPFKMAYADPSEPEYIDRMNVRGLNVIAADNSVMPGINSVYKRFEVQDDGFPRIYIHERCGNLIDELHQYRYAEVKEDKEHKEAPLKVNDHACDALRYALHNHQFGSKGYTIIEGNDAPIF